VYRLSIVVIRVEYQAIIRTVVEMLFLSVRYISYIVAQTHLAKHEVASLC